MFHLMIIEFMYLFWGQEINILFLFLYQQPNYKQQLSPVEP